MSRSFGIAAALVIGFVSFASMAQASTPPLSEEELMAESDLVLHARVVTAECAGPAQVGDLETVSTYLSALEPIEVLKGEAPEEMAVLGYRSDGPEAGCDERPQPLGAGFEGKLYLVEVNPGLYEPAHWSGVVEAETSAPEPLAACEQPPPINEEVDDPAANELDVAACSTAAPGGASGAASVAIMGLAALALSRVRRRRNEI